MVVMMVQCVLELPVVRDKFLKCLARIISSNNALCVLVGTTCILTNCKLIFKQCDFPEIDFCFLNLVLVRCNLSLSFIGRNKK
jgi:hypothetical protein